MKRLATIFLMAHIAALALGLVGIVYVMPHATDLRGSTALRFYVWAIGNGGSLGMITGALAAFAWGVWALGWRRTTIFFVVACSVSAAAELTGTKTGWPFGGYEYLSFLGWKIAGRVPLGIPLSWFYMGFVAYALAHVLVGSPDRRGTLSAIALGSWLLVAWDLVLDPAMAALPNIQFWAWHEHGSYFGMPLRNLAGWYATGFAFIALSRWWWGTAMSPIASRAGLALGLYAANVVWAMLLALSAGLWPTVIAALLFVLLPATFGFSRRAVA